jgi:predicted PurR-regulated permease PerM
VTTDRAQPQPTPGGAGQVRTDPEAAAPSGDPVEERPGPGPQLKSVFWYGVVGALGVLTVFLGAWTVYVVRTVLVQVVIAVFIAVSLDPAVRWMISRGVKRAHAVLVILLFVVLITAGLLWLVLPPLIREVPKLVSDFPGYLNHLRDRSPSLARLEDRFNLQQKISDYAAHLPARLGGQAITFGRRFLGALVSTLLIVVLTIYFMADLPRLRRALVRLFPKRHRPHVSHAINVVIDKVGGYMIGNVIISVFAGVAAFIAFMGLRIPFAVPLAVLVALLDLVPMVGATLGAAVSVVVALATTDLWPNTILLAVFFLLYQQLENYLIAPRVLRNAVQMSALGVLLVALLGGSVLGLVGALMAIPVAAAVKAVATPVIRAREQEPAGDAVEADAAE